MRGVGGDRGDAGGCRERPVGTWWVVGGETVRPRSMDGQGGRVFRALRVAGGVVSGEKREFGLER